MRNVEHGMTQHSFQKSLTAKRMIRVLVNLGIGIIHPTSDETMKVLVTGGLGFIGSNFCRLYACKAP